MKKILNHLPAGILFLLKTCLTTLIFFTVFRIVFVLVNGLNQLQDATFSDFFSTFITGLRYDTTSAGYLLIIPFVIVLLAEIIPIKDFRYKKYFLYLLTAIYSFAFLVMAVDIPYFAYFNTRLTSSIFNWMSDPKIVSSFLLESSQYYIYPPIIILMIFLFYKIEKRFVLTWQNTQFEKPSSKLKISLLFILLALFQFAAIRGKITTRRPLSFGDAFNTTVPFLNYTGLNPIFTLGKTYFTKSSQSTMDIQLMDEALAIANVRRYLNINTTEFDSPIARKCLFETEHKHNVVVIMMESMGSCLLGNSNNFTPSLTPFLDSLISQSAYFPNFYSDGIHTYNGVWTSFTSLFSPPSETNVMMDINNVQKLSGIASILKDNNYSTIFFCSHDANFDNMGGMLSMNGFEKVISPSSEYFNKDFVNTWGTSDGVLFNNSLAYIKKSVDTKKPFLAAMLTISNHGPYKLPEPLPNSFKSNYPKDIQKQAVEYSDWALKTFFDSAKKQSWFKNTIFVLMADHGVNLNPNYEVNYNYKHIPLIIYAPDIVEPQVNNNLGCQADMFPTVMNFLGINYINNTLGVNLFKEKREFVPHSQHSTLLACNDSLMFIRRDNGVKLLYKFKNFDMKDYATEYPELCSKMEEYVMSYYQTSMYLVKSKKGKFISSK